MIAVSLSINIKPSTGFSGAPAAPAFLLLANGTDFLLLADGTSKLLIS